MQVGITFDQCNVTSMDDAHFHHVFLNCVDGVTKGCAVTSDGTNLYVAKGYFVIYGRFVKVTGIETVTPDAVVSGKMYERLVYEIDLSKTNTDETFAQGYFKVIASASGYPSLTQQDLENGGTIYQMEFAKFMVSSSGISSFVNDANTLNIADFFSSLEATLNDYKDIADGMIEELQNEGFVTQDAYHTDNTPEQITIATTDWTASGSNFVCTKACSKASTSAYCRLDLYPANPSSLTVANLRALKKALGLLYPELAVGNGTITFTAGAKPAVQIKFNVVGGIAQEVA